MNQLRRLAAGGRSTHTSGSGGSESAAIGVFSCFGAPPAGATAASWPGGPAGAATSLAAAGNASMSGGLGDGFLDWFNGAASAALGLDWLSSEIGATHAEEESALAPVQTTLSTRRRGGGRTGRRTRPPVQTSTPAVDTEASIADWTDENVRIVCEPFAEQVEIGNRSSTHLNKAGFTNVIQKFKQGT